MRRTPPISPLFLHWCIVPGKFDKIKLNSSQILTTSGNFGVKRQQGRGEGGSMQYIVLYEPSNQNIYGAEHLFGSQISCFLKIPKRFQRFCPLSRDSPFLNLDFNAPFWCATLGSKYGCRNSGSCKFAAKKLYFILTLNLLDVNSGVFTDFILAANYLETRLRYLIEFFLKFASPRDLTKKRSGTRESTRSIRVS